MEASEYPEVSTGEGYAVGDLDDLGDGPGFRKVRKGLGVTAFGVNAIVMPPGIESGFHYHDEQEELYFVHRGTIEIEFGDGSVQRWRRAASRASTPPPSRKIRNVGRRRRHLPVRRRQGRLHRPRRARARGRGASASKRSTTSPPSSRSEPQWRGGLRHPRAERPAQRPEQTDHASDRHPRPSPRRTREAAAVTAS